MMQHPKKKKHQFGVYIKTKLRFARSNAYTAIRTIEIVAGIAVYEHYNKTKQRHSRDLLKTRNSPMAPRPSSNNKPILYFSSNLDPIAKASRVQCGRAETYQPKVNWCHDKGAPSDHVAPVPSPFL
ncbi:hypothetical protein U1Q18_009319 [Sarracenia purpurea var. burkii]